MSSAALSPIAASLYVAFGGAIGAVGRYHLGRAVTHLVGPGAAFPWPTLVANVLGSLAMGLIFGWLAHPGNPWAGSHESIRLFVGVGLLGGFTTFSAFSLEMLLLIERGTTTLAVAYAGVSVFAGLVALYLGLVVMRATA